MSHVTTRVLDSARGVPAAGVSVMLMDAGGVTIARGVTDDDGRVAALGPDRLPVDDYRLVFDTGGYFSSTGTRTFYPTVAIEFTIADASATYDIPLVLGPFGYSTHRS